jgi:hypothetical protein
MAITGEGFMQGKKDSKGTSRRLAGFALAALLLLLVMPSAFPLNIDESTLSISPGGTSSSSSFTTISASEQTAIGEASSGSFNTFIGWAYTLDFNSPFVYDVSPANGSTVVDTQTVSFSLDDYWAGINISGVAVYINGTQSSAFDAESQCTSSGLGYNCSYSETGLDSSGDYNITAMALDFQGNEGRATTVFTFSKTEPPVPPTPPGPSGGTGSETIVSSPGGGGPPPQKPQATPCSADSDCTEGYRCVSGKCAKFFDVKIVRADTPVKAGETFDFVYLLKNPLGSPVDAEVEYWLEKDGEKIVEGREVVFIGKGEEKEFESNLPLLGNMLGKYQLVVQLVFEGTKVFATKDIEVKTSVELALDLHISRLPAQIKTGPLQIDIFVGTNMDESTSVKVNQAIMRGNEIVWKSEEQLAVRGSRRITIELPILPPGDYRLVLSAAGGGATASIIRNFTVETRTFEAPTVVDIVSEKAFEFSIIALLLSIAAILSWHNLIVVKFVSKNNPARARIKFTYFTIFALAFFLLLGFTVWSLSDLLREFLLNEFYTFMESAYGIALQQVAADSWDYFTTTWAGQQLMGMLGPF